LGIINLFRRKQSFFRTFAAENHEAFLLFKRTEISTISAIPDKKAEMLAVYP